EPMEDSRRFKSITLNGHRSFGGLHITGRTCGLLEELGSFAPDCVFIPGWSRRYSIASLRWCFTHGIPAVLMSETTEHDAPRFRWKEWIKRRIITGYSAALVGGSLHAEYLVGLGMPRDRILQGYDAVDNDYFQRTAAAARAQSARFRQEFRLPAKYFLASARFIEKKNLCCLVEAYGKYREASAEAAWSGRKTGETEVWSLVLLGDGHLRPALHRLVCQLRLEPFVILPGFKQYSELPVYYGLANAFVQASTSEPWGLVVNEAMASGLPVLVSNRCGCAPDLVCEGRNGFTFGPGNCGQIAELMLRFSEPSFPLSRFGKTSIEIISNWGLDRFSRALLAAARKATAPSSQSAASAGQGRSRWLLSPR